MNTFHDLFRQPTRRVGGEFPKDRRGELLPGFVARSRKLHAWFPDEGVTEKGPRLLIGVATWSGYDMNLLDLIEESPDSPTRVDVFDTAACGANDDFEKFVPGLGQVLQTPVVGFWVDGRLVESAQGYDGRLLVVRVCNLDADEVDSRLRTVLTRL